MKKSLTVTTYVYAYFSKYNRVNEGPSFMSFTYELSASEDYVLISTIPTVLEFEVPESVVDYTPARLAAFAAKITAIQLQAAEDTREINDQMQKLLSIEYSPAAA